MSKFIRLASVRVIPVYCDTKHSTFYTFFFFFVNIIFIDVIFRTKVHRLPKIVLKPIAMHTREKVW